MAASPAEAIYNYKQQNMEDETTQLLLLIHSMI